MVLIPLADAVGLNKQTIHLVATDMDGTLTRHGRFTSSLFEALEALADANISVLLVTGRSAGWVQGLKTYLPVTGAIAENGGVFLSPESEKAEILTEILDLKLHRQQLAEMFEYLKRQFPLIIESADNCFRLTDWTFDIQELTFPELQLMEKLCAEKGWGFTYSNVQCHIKPLKQDKDTSLLQVIKKYFPNLNAKQVVTVGDSPNDESLFDPSNFPLSVGVANVVRYKTKLKHLPVYVTAMEEGEGFAELTRLLLRSQATQPES